MSSRVDRSASSNASTRSSGTEKRVLVVGSLMSVARRGRRADHVPVPNATMHWRHTMKITDLTITVFAWDGLPRSSTVPTMRPRRVRANSARDDRDRSGVEGHAFLGSACEARSSTPCPWCAR